MLIMPKIKQAIFTIGTLFTMSTSCADMNKKMEAKTAKNIQTLCILCNIIGAKITHFFALIKKKCRFAPLMLHEIRRLAISHQYLLTYLNK